MNAPNSPSRPNRYLETKVMTASPVELRLMLYDGAIRHLDAGIEGLETKDFEAVYNSFSKCQSIVLELLNSIERDENPELYERLSGLYTFMYLELVRASSQGDLDKAREVRRLLEYDRETWQLLLVQLRDENTSGAASADEVAQQATTTRPTTTPDVPTNLVGARVSLEG